MSYIASEIIIYDTSPISFIDIQDSIISSRKIWLSEHAYPDNLILFHYTNLEGLEGIIKERAFRCTQFDYLKDRLELLYGRELKLQKLKYFIHTTGTTINTLSTSVKHVKTLPIKFDSSTYLIDMLFMFIVCF